MDCTDVRERLHELVRGRVDAAEAAELRRHLGACAACVHEARAEELLDAALTERLAPARAPASLRERVVAALERGAPPASPAPVARRPRPARAALAAAAALAVAALGFVAGRAAQGEAAATARLADELVTDHLRALASARPPDVESGSSHEVKPWFAGRLEFAPAVPADRGELRLLGGSVGYVLDRKAAVLSYALRRHRVTLLAFPRAGLPGFERAPATGAPLRLARRGFDVLYWAAGDVGYALVSDVEPGELGRLADALAAETRRE